MLKKLSEKIGFTKTEIKVILFLTAIFAIGFGTKYFFKRKKPDNFQKYDYSADDSIFKSSANNSSTENKEIGKENVDYKQEVLDFNKTNFTESKKKELTEKSININTASVEDLIKLPGIGIKTAGNIINFRQKISKFQKLEDLLEVKGIGTSKFNKIKNYLYIE